MENVTLIGVIRCKMFVVRERCRCAGPVQANRQVPAGQGRSYRRREREQSYFDEGLRRGNGR